MKPEYTQLALGNLNSMCSSQIARKTFGDYPLETMILEDDGRNIIDKRFQQWLACGGLHTIVAASVKYRIFPS